MSATSTRLTPKQARTIADHLTKIWGLGSDCLWCGSLRRERPDVGDLDLVAALPDGKDDPLFDRIDATLEKDQEQLGMFGQQPAKPIGVALRGHKPHFKAAYYELRTNWKTEAGERITVGVNVFRYQPGNKGWTIVRCTGPADFGKMFLDAWKKRHGIAAGEDNPASIEGHLVDKYGVAIPTETEADAFRLCDMKYVEPNRRDQVAAHWARASGGGTAPSRRDFPS